MGGVGFVEVGSVWGLGQRRNDRLCCDVKKRTRSVGLSVVTMGGKKKGRGGSGESGGNGGSTEEYGAPRVKSNSSLGLKRQLWLVKETARRTAVGGKAVERTSFRKKKEKTRNSSSDADDDCEEYVRVPKGKYNKKAAPILFVDGYNVIGYWAKLKKRRDKNDLKGARELLNEELKRYAGIRGWSCVIVYDAQFSSRKCKFCTTSTGSTSSSIDDTSGSTSVDSPC